MRAYFTRHVFIGRVVLSMGLLYWCATTAAAPIVEAQTNQAAPDVAVGVLNPTSGDTRPIHVVERRYKIEALSFRCLDETGYDSPFFAPWISDEVMMILRDPERKVLTVSRLFDDVDTNETRNFPPHENCILPVRDVLNGSLIAPRDSWTCGEAGASGPFSFSVEMYEADSDFWNESYHCWIDFGCPFSISPPGYQADSSNFTKGDELIGLRTLTFTSEELAAAMPNVHDTVDETTTLGPCFDDREMICTEGLFTPTGPKYTFTYRLTRLPDRTVSPVLDPGIQ